MTNGDPRKSLWVGSRGFKTQDQIKVERQNNVFVLLGHLQIVVLIPHIPRIGQGDSILIVTLSCDHY